MEMIINLLLTIIDFLSSSSGLIFQSILIILLIDGSLSLVSAAKRQIQKNDLRHARSSFASVIVLNLVLVSAYLVKISNLLVFPVSFYTALQQLVWSMNLILVGWLWIKPDHQPQLQIFKRIFLCTAVGFFLLEIFNPIEMLFSPVEIAIPYFLIWRVFEFIVSFFLLFIYFFHTGKMRFASLTFALLQIFGLGASEIFTISPQFAQTFSQLLAFLFSTKIFLAIALDYSELENDARISPVILSENLTAIPNAANTKAWLQTILESDASILPFALCKALAHTMGSDACVIIKAPKNKSEMKIICGYSLEHKKQLIPQTVFIEDEIITQKRSVLFHDPESFPDWIKVLIKIIHHTQTRSAWYIPLESSGKKYFLVFLSQKNQWANSHIAYLKKIMPELVQILHNYFGEDHKLLPEKSESEASSNPFLDLMQSENNYTKDIHQVEAELQLALEEYNRIRKILEERGIGQ
ncbi:MAG: hypothetical protein AB2L18_00825 [Anaerolineaceae bacterium]